MNEWLVLPPGHVAWDSVSVDRDNTALITGIPALYDKTVRDACVCTMARYLDSQRAWQSLAPQGLTRLLHYIHSNMVMTGLALDKNFEGWMRTDFGVKQCLEALGAASEACADVFTVLFNCELLAADQAMCLELHRSLVL